MDASATFPLWVQITVPGVANNIVFLVAERVFVCLAADMVERQKRSSRMQRLAQRAGGTILVGLDLKVALQRSGTSRRGTIATQGSRSASDRKLKGSLRAALHANRAVSFRTGLSGCFALMAMTGSMMTS